MHVEFSVDAGAQNGTILDNFAARIVHVSARGWSLAHLDGQHGRHAVSNILSARM